jgi:hypothetical protein
MKKQTHVQSCNIINLLKARSKQVTILLKRMDCNSQNNGAYTLLMGKSPEVEWRIYPMRCW